MQTQSSARARAVTPPFDPDRPAWIDHGDWVALDDDHRATLARLEAAVPPERQQWRNPPPSFDATVVPPGHLVIHRPDGARRVTARRPTIWGYPDDGDPDSDPRAGMAEGEPAPEPTVVVEDNFEPDPPEGSVFGGRLPDWEHPDWVPPPDLSGVGYLREVTAAQFEAMPDPAWLWPSFAIQGGHGVSFARPKAGKTLFAVLLAVAVSARLPELFGRPLAGQGDVVYLIAEGNSKQFYNRVRAAARSLGLPGKPEGLRVVPVKGLNVGLGADQEMIARSIRDKWPDAALVVVDTMVKTAGGSLNDDAVVNRYNAGVDAIRGAWGEVGREVAVRVLTHLSVKEAGGRTAMGSSFIYAAPDGLDEMVKVRGDDGAARALVRVTELRDGDEADFGTLEMEFLADADGHPYLGNGRWLAAGEFEARARPAGRRRAGAPPDDSIQAAVAAYPDGTPLAAILEEQVAAARKMGVTITRDGVRKKIERAMPRGERTPVGTKTVWWEKRGNPWFLRVGDADLDAGPEAD